jgi:hypothetical protein
VITLRNDPDIVEGWGVRDFNWETSFGIQHELMPRVSVNASYNRRVYGPVTVVDNLAVAPSDYSPFCITVPNDSRLPRSGEQICDLYDIQPAMLGRVDRFRTLASNYGEQYEYWHGVDTSVDARLRNGVIIQGGLSTGRRITDNCDVVTKVDNPSRLYCHTDHPFWVPSVKFLAAYPLPKQFQIAATFQSMPGVGESNNQVIAPQVQAQYVATNAEIAPSLGRNLAAGPNGTVTVNVVEPGSLLSDRMNQLDLRLSRRFTIGKAKLMGMFDAYNVLNVNPVMAWNDTYGRTGATWLSPVNVLPGRILKFSAQFDF